MSAYADLDLDTSRHTSRRRDALKARAADLADGARTRFASARDRGMELASASGAKAAHYARNAADHAKRRPVSTGLIVAAVGVGLVFLLSRSARSAAVSFSEDLMSRYAKR